MITERHRLTSLVTLELPTQIPQAPIVHLPEAIQTNNPNTISMPHPSDLNSHAHQQGSKDGRSSTYVSIYLSSSHLFLSCVSSMVLISPFRMCSACGKPIQGPFVRALGSVIHLNCFRCMVCPPTYLSPHFRSYPDRIVVISLRSSSSQSTAQMENRIPYARKITSGDSTSCVKAVDRP